MQALIMAQNKIVKAQSGDKSPDYNGPNKWSEEQWENNEVEVQRVVEAAARNKE